jgi:hypothetical protein
MVAKVTNLSAAKLLRPTIFQTKFPKRVTDFQNPAIQKCSEIALAKLWQ